MGIELVWDDEARSILRYDFQPGWTLDDFDVAERQLHELLADVPHTIDVIAHFVPGTEPPIGAFSRFRQIQEEMPPQVGVVIVTNGGPLVAMLLAVFLRVYHQYAARLWLADSLEDARRQIAARPRT